MDDSDRATQFEELRRQIALKTLKPSGPAPTGYCLHCGETVMPGHRWCDTDCRDDWEARQRAHREAPWKGA